MRNFLPFLVLLLAVGCTPRQSTVLLDSWSDDVISSPAYDKMLVIGVAPNPDSEITFEHRMQKVFQKRGIDVTTWHDVLSRDLEVSDENYRKYFADQDIDAVLITRVLQVEELPPLVPSNRRDNPPSELYDNFFNYYQHVRVEARAPQEFQPGRVVFLETHVYDTDGGDLVWAGQSKSISMDKPGRVLRDISKVVSGVLVQEGIIR